jgi:hypothetical protein
MGGPTTMACQTHRVRAATDHRGSVATDAANHIGGALDAAA